MKKILSLSVSGLMLLNATCAGQDVITPATSPGSAVSGATSYAAPAQAPTQASVPQGATIQQGGTIQQGAPVQTVIQQGTAIPQGATARPIVGNHPNSLPPQFQNTVPGQIIYGPQNYPIDMNGFQPQQIWYNNYGQRFNPVVIQTPTQVQNVQYDQFGRVIIDTSSQIVHESAFNQGRNQVVPGSLRNVNRYETDQFGNQIHVTGQEWIGLDGQPHANLNRNTQTNIGGTIIRNDDVQVYRSQGPPK